MLRLYSVKISSLRLGILFWIEYYKKPKSILPTFSFYSLQFFLIVGKSNVEIFLFFITPLCSHTQAIVVKKKSTPSSVAFPREHIMSILHMCILVYNIRNNTPILQTRRRCDGSEQNICTINHWSRGPWRRFIWLCRNNIINVSWKRDRTRSWTYTTTIDTKTQKRTT